MKVLIADDEETILEIEAKRLRAEGYEVVTASDGIMAADLIRSERPDVVVLDLTMPGKDGFTILKDLKENPISTKWLPVIIVSARGELEDMRSGFNLNADHYIHKPCRPEDVIHAVKLMESLIPLRQ